MHNLAPVVRKHETKSKRHNAKLRTSTMTTESKLESRARRRLEALNDSDRQETRREVELLVKKAFEKAETAQATASTSSSSFGGGSSHTASNNNKSIHAGNSPRRRFPSLDNSQSSFQSIEHIFRKRRRSTSKRGLFARNCSDDQHVHKMLSWENSSKNNKPDTSRDSSRPRRIFFQHRNSEHLAAEVSSKEAWMCGVCGQTFSSFDAAERHEQYHIQEIVSDLGWNYGTALDSISNVPPVLDTIGNSSQPIEPLQVDMALDNMRTPQRSNRSSTGNNLPPTTRNAVSYTHLTLPTKA